MVLLAMTISVSERINQSKAEQKTQKFKKGVSWRVGLMLSCQLTNVEWTDFKIMFYFITLYHTTISCALRVCLA